MKKFIECSVFFLIVFNIIGCTKTEGINDEFTTAIHNLLPPEEINSQKAFVVIPGTGCSGCITNAEEILKKYYNSTRKVKFILTRVSSVKQLRLKLNINLDTITIIIDRQDIFSRGKLHSIYPRVYFLDDGIVQKSMEISPKEDGLSELLKLTH